MLVIVRRILLIFALVPFARAAEPTATIKVGSPVVLRSIPSTLFGTNLEWIWNGDLVWSGDAVDSRFAPLIQESGTTLFRFPGGLFADFYDWRKGIGPVSRRPLATSMPGGAVSTNDFGTAEALRLARQFNGKLLITINAGSGTPEMAAQWVEYINKNGVGPRVDYWEIGNELYIPAPSINGVSIATLNAQQYAAKFMSFAAAMKAVDPTIKIGAILDESFSTRQSSPWTTTVLTTASEQIDFVAIHNAYAPTLAAPTNQDVHSVYQAMLAAPGEVAANLASLASRIDELAPGRAGEIPIAVTEWGAFYHFDPRSPYIDHVKTMGSALYTASTLMSFIRSPRTVIANHFKISDPLFMGMIGLRNGEPAATASLYAMEIFTKHAGSNLIESIVRSPGFSTAGAGYVGSAVDVPSLDVVATLSDDRKHCFITVVNRDLDSPVVTDIDLGAFVPKSTATAWTLKGSAIDANTGTTTPAGYIQTTQAQWARFYSGGPSEVTLTTQDIPGVAAKFSYRFPAASVVSIDIPLN